MSKSITMAVKVEDDSWFDTSVGSKIKIDGIYYKILGKKLLEVGNWYSEYELRLKKLESK